MPPIVGICGRSNVGKTRLIEHVLPFLVARGRRVGVAMLSRMIGASDEGTAGPGVGSSHGDPWDGSQGLERMAFAVVWATGADPEVDGAFLASLTDYVLFLAPPTRRPVPPEERAAVREGERTFEALGCTSCHTPVLTTGPSESPALDRKAFRVYSDLLLHDLGPDLADICAPGATPSEWRTARLVGLGLRSEFMHNGRAQRLDDAIRLHGGEGSSARDAYAALSDGERQDLLRFLQTL